MITSIAFCIVDRLNDPSLLSRCAAAIRRQGLADFEILICGRSDPLIQGTRFLPGGRDISSKWNHLVQETTKDYVLFIDSSVELAPDWGDWVRSADCFDVVTTAMTTPGGQRVVDWACFDRRAKDHFPRPVHYDEWSPRAFVSGLLILVRKDVLENVALGESPHGGYDEEADFCRRAEEMGYRCGAAIGARAIYYGPTDGRGPRQVLTFDDALRLAGKGKQVPSSPAGAAMVQYPLSWRARMRVWALLYRIAARQLKRALGMNLRFRKNPPGQGLWTVMGKMLSPYRFIAGSNRQGRQDAQRCWECLCGCVARQLTEISLYDTGSIAMVICVLSRGMPIAVKAVCPAPDGPAWRLSGWKIVDEQTLVDDKTTIVVANTNQAPVLRNRLIELGVASKRVLTMPPRPI